MAWACVVRGRHTVPVASRDGERLLEQELRRRRRPSYRPRLMPSTRLDEQGGRTRAPGGLYGQAELAASGCQVGPQHGEEAA